ncbi:unnamed protein product [Effrenium voratum]|nr:unnamed protein product [Effrenium voratum]
MHGVTRFAANPVVRTVQRALQGGPSAGKSKATSCQKERALDLSRKLVELARRRGSDKAAAANIAHALARSFKSEFSTFQAQDVVQLATALQKLRQKNVMLLDAMASHVLRGIVAYPLYALCNIPNCFARLGYLHRQLMDAVASHVSERADKLTPVDIASCLR